MSPLDPSTLVSANAHGESQPSTLPPSSQPPLFHHDTLSHKISPTMPQLPQDIILSIIHYLRRPLPPAHSKSTDRSLIRQPDLFACLFVCRDWYNTAAPLLYRYVVTDDLPSFLFCRRLRSLKPEIIFLPIPGLIPKRELLGFTQRLFIEYAHKDGTGVDKDRDKAQGVTGGLMDGVGVAEAREYIEEGLGPDNQAIREVQALSDALRLFTGYPVHRRHNPLIQLRTLSVGAFFGHEEEELRATCWRLPEGLADYQRMVRETQHSFAQLVAQTPGLQHYCQMPPTAPLSLGDQCYLPGIHDSRPSVAFHEINGVDFSTRSAIGVHSRWYTHEGQWQDYPSRQDYHEESIAEFQRLISYRDASTIKHGRAKAHYDILVEVYHSLPPWVHDVAPNQDPIVHTFGDRVHPKSEDEKAAWRVETEHLSKEIMLGVGRRVRKPLPEGIDPVDKVTWGQLFDAPPCEACGWRYEE